MLQIATRTNVRAFEKSTMAVDRWPKCKNREARMFEEGSRLSTEVSSTEVAKVAPLIEQTGMKSYVQMLTNNVIAFFSLFNISFVARVVYFFLFFFVLPSSLSINFPDVSINELYRFYRGDSVV